MNYAQYQFRNLLIQNLCGTRSQLHEWALTLLGLVFLAGVLALAIFCLWILSGRFSRHFCLDSPAGRKLVREWLYRP